MSRCRFMLELVTCLALALGIPAVFADPGTPTLPGDCDFSWQVDMDDYNKLPACTAGPNVPVDEDCACFDLDQDGDVDLQDFGRFQLWYTGAAFQVIEIVDDNADGTEVNQSEWLPDGFPDDRNGMGAGGGGDVYDIGLHFQLPDVSAGQQFKYARLAVPATDNGTVTESATLRIVGVAADSPPDFTSFRPSEMPKTDSSVNWVLSEAWPGSEDDFDCTPVWRNGPDISPIINEILSSPTWGGGPQGKTLVLVIEDDGSPANNFLSFQDYREINDPDCLGTVSARLELYRTVGSTFIARELLGRLTDHSVTVHALSLLTLEVYFEVGVSPGVYTAQTSPVEYPGGVPMVAKIDSLDPNTRYYYRMRYRQPEDATYQAGVERTFHTQRPPGSGFVFTVQADSHGVGLLRVQDTARLAQYQLTVLNAFADEPDFHLSLGDFGGTEVAARGRSVLDFQEAVHRNLLQRPMMDIMCHSAGFYRAVGNHEGEQGWYLDGTADNLAIWCANARKFAYPNPAPDDFYTGNTEEREFTGLLDDYYAWEWGDALFVVIDPYAYTFVKPHTPSGSQDNWDWSLGLEQYQWLRDTLAGSDATFKFVFTHQLAGGTTTYGRGGIEAASHALGGVGSFEWGGENLDGTWGFDEKRPGWETPVHQLMAENNVTIFFHGHDHFFAKQDLDGIVYQEVPMPGHLQDEGTYEGAGYVYGDILVNSGHIRVTVSPCEIIAEYVRAFLPGDGENGVVSYAYTIPGVGGTCGASGSDGAAQPATGGRSVTIYRGEDTVTLEPYDLASQIGLCCYTDGTSVGDMERLECRLQGGHFTLDDECWIDPCQEDHRHETDDGSQH